jgi:hypothetical protein
MKMRMEWNAFLFYINLPIRCIFDLKLLLLLLGRAFGRTAGGGGITLCRLAIEEAASRSGWREMIV